MNIYLNKQQLEDLKLWVHISEMRDNDIFWQELQEEKRRWETEQEWISGMDL